MRVFWGGGQFCVDRRRKGMHQIGIIGVIHPEAGATLTAKPRFSLTDEWRGVFWILNTGVVDRQVVLTLNFECPMIARQVDCVPATARRFAADRAIAAHIGVRLLTLHAKAYCTTMA